MELKQSRSGRLDTLFHRSRSSASSIVSHLSVEPKAQRLCDICQSIRISTLREGKSVIHGKPGQIKFAAQNGCPFCGLLIESFDLGPESLPVRLHGIKRKLSLLEKEAFVEDGDIEAIRILHGYDRDEDNPYAHRLALWTTYDDVSASSIIRRPFIEDFASDESFRLIKFWLDDCVFHHPGCTAAVITQLPTRVIDIGKRGNKQDPVLFVPPKGFKGSYVALSYCWGTKGAKYVLTKAHTNLVRTTFPLTELPQTMKDAVQITQKLGFRYLWIDALCIIQDGDDGEDFRCQSATMHQVYGNATLTLAAAASASVHDGIFRKPQRQETTPCKISYDLPDGSIGKVFVGFESADEGRSRISAPLNTRAWTFQERILSPRVVLFYKDQISWDCSSRLIDSNGPLNPLLNLNQDSPGRYSAYIAAASLSTEIQSSPRLNSEYMAYWKKSVEFYSRRGLTNPLDKLRAISGLAKLIHSKTQDEYLAGIWRSDLHSQLYWRTDEPRAQNQSLYQAPSWSWASGDGHIMFTVDEGDGMDSQKAVDEVHVEYASDSDRFGDVQSAQLRVRGHLQSWDHEFDKGCQDRFHSHSLNVKKDCLQCIGIFFDQEVQEVVSSQARNKQLYFFRLVHRVWPKALIVERTGDIYRRVGFYESRTGLSHTRPHHKWAVEPAIVITII